MYYVVSVLMGAIIAVMVMVNGELTALFGLHQSTVIIHIVGLVSVAAVVGIRRQRVIPRHKLPWYCFAGGAVGVLTTVFNNVAYGHISVSALLALGLLGQSVFSLLIDHFGWFEMEKRPMRKRKLIGLALCLGGVGVMLLW